MPTRRLENDYAHSIRQVVALRRAMDLLLAQPNVDSARVGIVGHDYGGMYSMMMAGVDQRARACVYVAVVPSLNDWAFLGPQPKPKADYLRQNAMLELTDYLRQNRKAATLLQFGTRDVFVSRVDSGIIAAAAGTKDRRFYGADHAMNRPEIVADRNAFLLKELGASLEPPPGLLDGKLEEDPGSPPSARGKDGPEAVVPPGTCSINCTGRRPGHEPFGLLTYSNRLV